MQEERTEGIVLRSFDYKDHQKILTLFTPKEGLMSLIVYGLSSRKTHLLALSSPFCQGEFVYKKTAQSELHRFLDGAVIDEHLNFRTQYRYLQTAGLLSQAILRSQLPGKSAPLLYSLFRTYFKQIPLSDDPSALSSSFYLKLLKHEGLSALAPSCNRCTDHPAQHLYAGECLCTVHRAPGSLDFTQEEWQMLLALEGASHFQTLHSLAPSSSLSARIAAYFEERLHQS